MRTKKRRSEMRSNRAKNRDEIARENIKEKYRKEGTERIIHNEEQLAKNERMLKQLQPMQTRLGIMLRMENAKLSGLEVLRPTFEFEKSETWRGLQEEFVLFGIGELKKQIEETDKNIESMLEQNQRLIKEIEVQKQKIEQLDTAVLDGEEVDLGIDVETLEGNKPAAS